MTKDIPEVFEGIIKIDETYLGGQTRNKRKEIKLKSGKTEDLELLKSSLWYSLPRWNQKRETTFLPRRICLEI